MHAALQVAYGDIEDSIRIENIPVPEPGPGEVLLRVRGSTLNRKDLFALANLTGPALKPRPPLPHVNGADAAGEVAGVGPGVSGWQPGDLATVYGVLYCNECYYCQIGEQNACVRSGNFGEQVWGGHAEYVTVPARALERLPATADLGLAACLNVTYTTAWRALVTGARVQAGETVVIVGASGGVGTAAIQIARLAGCRVIAVAGGAWKAEQAVAAGADAAIDHQREDFTERTLELTDGRGADVVLDPVGAATWRKSIQALAKFGRMAICGAGGGDTPDISIREIYLSHRQIIGTPQGSRADFQAVLQAYATGRLEPVVHRRYPLTDIHSALREYESGAYFGKIVLDI